MKTTAEILVMALDAQIQGTILCDAFYSIADSFIDPLHRGDTVLVLGGKVTVKQ